MKEGDISLFKNTKKTEDKHPDYTGKCMVNGKEMRVAAWIKKGESGLAFFSGKISEFEMKSDNIADPLNSDTAIPAGEKSIQEQKLDAMPPDDLPFVLTIPILPLIGMAASGLALLCI